MEKHIYSSYYSKQKSYLDPRYIEVFIPNYIVYSKMRRKK